MAGKLFLWGLASLFALRGESTPLRLNAPAPCVDVDRQPVCADPGAYLRDFLVVINRNRHQPISKVIEALAFPKGTAMGAEFSHSLQASGTFDNPRLHLQTPCGSLTINLRDSTIEMAIAEQTAAPHLRLSVGAGTGVFSSAKGEVLLDLHPFPKMSGPFTAESITNTLDPRFPIDARNRSAQVMGQEIWHDTKRCSRCHVDTRAGGTRTSLGVLPLTVGSEKILAIVSPYERLPLQNAHHGLLGVPEDLERLRRCRCEPHPTAKDCDRFPQEPWHGASREEGCARLNALLAIRPAQHCAFDPARETPGPGETHLITSFFE